MVRRERLQTLLALVRLYIPTGPISAARSTPADPGTGTTTHTAATHASMVTGTGCLAAKMHGCRFGHQVLKVTKKD
jgi:hypothetical protein